MEDQILEEIRELMEKLESESSGKPVQVHRIFGSSISNVMCLYVTGKRYAYDDPIRKKLDDCFTPRGHGSRPSLFGYLAFMPIVPRTLSLLTFNSSKSQFESRMETLYRHVQQRVDYYKEKGDTGSATCFIDAYLKEMKAERSGRYFDDEHLMGCVFTFFLAGLNVITDYLTWFCLFMMLHPDIQLKLRQEVDQVIGSKKVSIMYRSRMPFTEAVMQELHRVTTVAPSGLAHCVSEDSVIGPYSLGKGTQIILSSFLVHRDADYFQDPESFRPERFIASDGSFIRDERVMAFGVGKRSCPGEPIAHNELFLFVTSLIQSFEILKPDGCNMSPAGVMDFGGRIPADPVEVILKKRE